MLPETFREELKERIGRAGNPRELVIDVMLEVQEIEGYLSDAALEETAGLLGMNPLELEELATFYNFIYRRPVGKYVIHVCDSVVCWMTDGYEALMNYIAETLGVGMGETTPDGLFTLLPVCCLGYCDRAPAIMINRTVYGFITREKIDEIIGKLRRGEAVEAER